MTGRERLKDETLAATSTLYRVAYDALNSSETNRNANAPGGDKCSSC